MQEEFEALNEAKKQDILLSACIINLSKTLTKEKFPPAIAQEFRDGLRSAVAPIQNCQEPDTNPIPLMGMMLEEYLRAASALIVAMAGMDSLQLEKKGVVSKDGQDLLQRGIEDHLIDLSRDVLKAHILSTHLSFIDFMKRKGQ